MLTDTTEQTIQQVVAARQHERGALLPILHDIQDALGYIPEQAAGTIAQALNLSRAEVHGVVTFYHHFRTDPAGRNVVQICRAEACQSMGAERLWAHACTQLGVDSEQASHGATTADGSVTLMPVYCLGLCATSPALALNDKVHARVDADAFDRLVDTARSTA